MEPLLFLGLPITEHWERSIQLINPHLLRYFINGKDYLHEIQMGCEKFIGKPTEEILSLKQMEELNIHILSLLKRINPHFPISRDSLILITINSFGELGRDIQR
jgi:hypothetical protein